MKQRFLSAMALVTLCFCGCAIGPTYRTPQVQVPQQWSQPAQGATEPISVDMTQWWKNFHDSVLDSLIDEARVSSLNLREAEARIREARATRGMTAAGLYPTLNTSVSYSHQKGSVNQHTTGSGVTAVQTTGGKVSDLFQVGFDAGWEIDLFGGVRRAVETADADLAAAQENVHDVLLTLFSEVARNYVGLRGYQRQLAIARVNIASQEDTLELTQSRFQAGLTSELDVLRAQAQLSATSSQIPLLESLVDQSIHQLGVLLGKEPNALQQKLSVESALPPTPPEVPMGLPSDLLRRRPDVRQAERELAAATARVGVAMADWFPKFSLTGSFGRQGENPGALSLGANQFWGIGPSVRWPFFDAGRIRANIQVQNARQEQSLIRYENAVLNSLKDVENAIVGYAKEQERRQSIAKAVEANRRSVEMSTELYSKGLIDFLNVLDAEKSLYTTEDQLVQSERDVVTNLIALYKALGGGWENYQ